MLNLMLIRKNPLTFEQNFTHGELFMKDVTGKWLDFCYTLEDRVRDVNFSGDFEGEEKKVYGETAIPFGKYDGQITYSPAFKKDLPLIKNVNNFEGIRIHSGNSIKDTAGCILVGFKTDWKGKIWESRKALNDLINIIEKIDDKKRFKLEII
jgi:hypothetical protein